MGSAPMNEITFAQICEIAPEVQRIYKLARILGRRKCVPYRPDEIFQDYFRLLIVRQVGFMATDPRLRTLDAWEVASRTIYQALTDSQAG
jgi:hypothetical protein